jgi:hypothetical protein
MEHLIPRVRLFATASIDLAAKSLESHAPSGLTHPRRMRKRERPRRLATSSRLRPRKDTSMRSLRNETHKPTKKGGSDLLTSGPVQSQRAMWNGREVLSICLCGGFRQSGERSLERRREARAIPPLPVARCLFPVLWLCWSLRGWMRKRLSVVVSAPTPKVLAVRQVTAR